MQEHDEQKTDKHRPIAPKVEEHTEALSQAAQPSVKISLAEADVSPAPSESFGSFDMPGSNGAGDPYTNPQNLPGQYPPTPMPGLVPYPPLYEPEEEPYPAMSAPAFYSPLSPYTFEPSEVYPPISSIKKPIYFPLARKLPLHMQFYSMLFYSLLMAISIMGICLTLMKAQQSGLGVFKNVDGSTNSLSVLLMCILILLVVPACSLLSGALFGSWRGPLVSLVSIGGGIFITHVTNNLFWNNPAPTIYLPLAALPISALVVGLVYDHRKYAAWWKSMLTMMLGAATISIWIVTLIFIAGVNSPSFASSSNPQSSIAGFWIGGAIISCVSTLALTFPIAAIEGLLHWRIAVEKRG